LSGLLARARRGALIPLALLLGACLPASGQAQELVSLHTSFTPDRLGASTTIGFGFTVKTTDGKLPSPLRHIGLRIPKGMDYLDTNLGLAICQPKALEAKGLSGCSPNSRLGFGKARVEVPFGSTSGREIPRIYALMGPERNENMVVLFYADGVEPVFAQLVFQGELLPAGGPFGSDLSTPIPLIPGVTGGPPVSIINVESTIGPEHLLYEKRVHGHVVRYHPRGVTIPDRCPRGGFRFQGEFAFEDGSIVHATSIVPCPGRRHK
jgi:hypothetical protein